MKSCREMEVVGTSLELKLCRDIRINSSFYHNVNKYSEHRDKNRNDTVFTDCSSIDCVLSLQATVSLVWNRSV